jgi:hypothetical protein
VVKDYKNFRNDSLLRRKFNRDGPDLVEMLDNQMHGRINFWAIRWCYSQFKNNMFTIYPAVSRVRNIGLDNSGAHSSNLDARFDGTIRPEATSYTLQHIEINPVISRKFKKYYGIYGERLKAKIDWYKQRLIKKLSTYSS